MMLSSAFRLGCRGRFAANLITRSMSLPSGRRPVKIINEEDEKFDTEQFNTKVRSARNQGKRSEVYRQNQWDNQYYVKSNIQRESEESDKDYSSAALSHPCLEENNDYKLSKYMVHVKSRRARRKAGITLLEGKRLIGDALKAGVKLKALFISRRSDLMTLPLPSYNFHLHWIPYKYIEKWTDVKTSSGVLAIVEIPSTKNVAPDPNNIPLTVVCDNIRDPGNMGAILRVLAGVGCSKVLITKGCVDIWEPKVLRAASGGHFRVPIEHDVNWGDLSYLVDGEPAVFLADSGIQNAVEISESLNNGLDSPSEDSASEDIASGDIASEDSASEDIASEDIASDDVNKQSNSSSKTDDVNLESNQSVNKAQELQTVPYYDIKLNAKSTNLLIVSNEYFGPSKAALAFTSSRKGVRVHIPLSGKVESLNVVSALSIISFEMRRQLSLL